MALPHIGTAESAGHDRDPPTEGCRRNPRRSRRRRSWSCRPGARPRPPEARAIGSDRSACSILSSRVQWPGGVCSSFLSSRGGPADFSFLVASEPRPPLFKEGGHGLIMVLPLPKGPKESLFQRKAPLKRHVPPLDKGSLHRPNGQRRLSRDPPGQGPRFTHQLRSRDNAIDESQLKSLLGCNCLPQQQQA